jgi:imidazolonepropionase-like amidohydrolase
MRHEYRHARSIVASLALVLTNVTLAATETPAAFVIRASQMLDVRSGTLMKDVLIHVEGERITAVSTSASAPNEIPAVTTIDLGDATVLPGLIDCHTHLLARIPETSDGYALNLLTKSVAFRALEGAANARATLDAGVTTVRDVGNEGSGYADVALRDAIDADLVPGPRMRVATRAIAAVGQYHPFGISTDLTDFPTGAQMVSGVDEARRAVREQIGHGADVIKVYADWDEPTLTVAELQVIVEEAHNRGREVAAHATTQVGIHNAVVAGVDSIEHGNRADRETLKLMKSQGTYLVPTLAAMDAWAAESPENAASPQLQTFMAASRASVANAKELGVRIANGSDLPRR